MKRVALILGLTLLVGCSNDEYSDSQYYSSDMKSDCGTIMSVVDDPAGDYIEVKMSYHNPMQRDRYKVANYMDYMNKIGKEICDFDGLTKIPY